MLRCPARADVATRIFRVGHVGRSPYRGPRICMPCRVSTAPKRDEVVRKLGRMLRGERATRIPNVTPSTSFELGPFRLADLLFGKHPLVEVACQIMDSEAADASSFFPAGHAAIQSQKLLILHLFIGRI